jgi:hypothetical protein
VGFRQKPGIVVKKSAKRAAVDRPIPFLANLAFDLRHGAWSRRSGLLLMGRADRHYLFPGTPGNGYMADSYVTGWFFFQTLFSRRVVLSV